MSRVKLVLNFGGNFMAASALWMTMNTRDEQFFKELGARIAQARKDHGLTQQALAEQLGVAQQTLAHYEVGRARAQPGRCLAGPSAHPSTA